MDNQGTTTNSPTTPPMNEHRPTDMSKSSSSAGHHLLFSFIALIILAAAVAGVYAWQHKKVNNLSSQVSGLNAQVSKLNAENSALSASKASESKSTATTTTACSATDLTPTTSESPGAAGNEGTAIILTNTSSASCTLYGYPTVQYFSSSNSLVSNVIEQLSDSMIFANPSPVTVTIAPGKTASFGLGYTVGGANPSNAATMQFTLPGQSTAIKLSKAYGPSTANTGDPYYIDVTAIQAGSSPQTN
jgi:outer membrane murein-binding lipoprotein Lpp